MLLLKGYMSFCCVDFVSFGSLSRDTREDNNCSLFRASKAQRTLAILSPATAIFVLNDRNCKSTANHSRKHFSSATKIDI